MDIDSLQNELDRLRAENERLQVAMAAMKGRNTWLIARVAELEDAMRRFLNEDHNYANLRAALAKAEEGK